MRFREHKSTGISRRSGGDSANGDNDVVINDPPAGTSIDLPLDQGSFGRHVLVAEDLVLSADDTIVVEFRRSSDSTWEQGAAAYRYERYFSGALETDPTNAAYIEALAKGASASNAVSIVMGIGGAGAAAPTTVHGRAWHQGDGSVFHGQVRDTNTHDRVRIRTLGGVATIDSGSVELLRNRDSISVDSISLAGESSWTITPPANTWMTEIICLDVGLSADSDLRVQVDSVATATYETCVYGNNFDQVAANTGMHVITPGGDVVSSNISGCLKVFGLQLNCPTAFFGRHYCIGDATGTRFWAGIETTGGVNSSMTVYPFTGGVTMNSGTLFAIHYVRTNGIIEHASLSAVTEHEFTGISKRNTLVMIAKGITYSVSDRAIMEFGAGAGPTYETGATDYDYHVQNAGSRFGLEGANIPADDGNRSTADWAFIIDGFDLAARTTVWDGANFDVSDTAPLGIGGFRKTRQKHNAIRIKTNGGATMTGDIWLIGAK